MTSRNELYFMLRSPSRQERFYLLTEECAEAQQAAMKALRHGLENFHPISGEGNKESLEKEIGHILFAVYLLWARDEVDVERVASAALEKCNTAKKWLHYQEGMLEEKYVKEFFRLLSRVSHRKREGNQ